MIEYEFSFLFIPIKSKEMNSYLPVPVKPPLFGVYDCPVLSTVGSGDLGRFGGLNRFVLAGWLGADDVDACGSTETGTSSVAPTSISSSDERRFQLSSTMYSAGVDGIDTPALSFSIAVMSSCILVSETHTNRA